MSVLKGAIPCLLLSTIVVAQAPERTFPPSVATRTVIETKLAELTRQIDALTAKRPIRRFWPTSPFIRKPRNSS